MRGRPEKLKWFEVPEWLLALKIQGSAEDVFLIFIHAF